MTQHPEIQKLLKAKARMEQRLKELDQKIDHVIFQMEEERRCLTRKCPFEPDPNDDIEYSQSE